MLKPGKTKFQKVIFLLIAFVFIFGNFFGILFLYAPKVQAQYIDPFQAPLQSMWYAGETSDKITTKVWDEIVAIFFKNILGNLANLIAQQSAMWVASGGKGEGPQFISDPNFWNNWFDSAAGDFVQTALQNLTGIDVCSLDPRIAINLTLNIPMFPEWQGYQPSCSWTQLRSHWEQIGQRKFEDFVSVDYGIGAGGAFDENVGRLNSVVAEDPTLRRWDIALAQTYAIDCSSGQINGSVITCSEPPVQTDLKNAAQALDAYTASLRADVESIITHRVAETPADLSVGRYPITPENMPIIRDAWLKQIEPYITTLSQTVTSYGQCQARTACALKENPCPSPVAGLNFQPFQCPIQDQAMALEYQSEFNQKAGQVVNIANALKGGYEYLKNQINDNFVPDLLEGSAAYNAQLAAGLFDPEANEFNAYDTITRGIMREGFSAWLDSRLQSTIDQGWQSVTDRIGGAIRTPSNLIRAKAEKDLAAGGNIASYYTKEIVADSLGVFLETLWNQMALQLLDLLNPQQTIETTRSILSQQGGAAALETSTGPSTWNPFEELITSPAGIQSYIEKLTQKFTVNFSFKDINLLADFQLNIKGQVNPNIYNNVIDSNFAIAINDNLTIRQAIDKGKLVGTYTFSWAEEAAPGTYNLSDIKKLRKARVVPLGLELAAELVRDCNYRKTFENGRYADFSDIDEINNFGYNLPTDPFTSQRLQNCLFKPYSGGSENLADVQNYNINKMNQVVNATLSDVVNGFDQAGSGTCGDFDDNESPFCNLVNPSWVLKLPSTRCAVQTDLEPYGELLTTNSNSQRYSRCPDFASCLQEDGKGGCVNEDYGFCVKEKNIWQFASNNCPSEFNSCRTYSVTGVDGSTNVSYLKNTLSGSGICGPSNAGCSWYSTKIDLAGAWQQSDRIYLNRYATTCDRQNEGCNEFSLYRNPNNNLVADSSFEYTPDGNFPANWDLRLKQEVPDAAACQGTYSESCINYEYDNQTDCLLNNGDWNGFCSDGISTTEAECLNNGATWDFICVNAINNQVNATDCSANGGDYKNFCTTSILKYNLCENPQFTDDVNSTAQEQCVTNNGTWQQECDVDGSIRSELTNEADCVANNGSWREFCQGAVLYNSNKEDCNNILGTWRGEGPFSDRAFVAKDGTDVWQGLSKLAINIGDLTADEELVLVYKSKFDDETKILSRPGDTYTATAYLKASTALNQPIKFNLAKMRQSQSELNSKQFYLSAAYSQADSTLITGSGGNELDILIYLPGNQPGAIVYLDGVDLSLNSLEQVRNYNFISPYTDYEANNKLYYKKPPERFQCHGYGPGDPPPVLDFNNKLACESAGGFWDQPEDGQPAIFIPDKTACYKYQPDDSVCSNFMKVCEPEEVGCQIYTPTNGDPQIPGVVSLTDYCPSECVGYDTFKQEPALYEPDPDPLYNYFIPQTAQSCTLAEVGCAQFTNLDAVAGGGEGIGYYTYLRQCIKPNLGLGEKTFFTWQGSASGPPQLIKYEFQSDSTTGAPKTIDNEGDCRLTLGEFDFNCVNFFDSEGVNYYRDIRKTISVSDDCHPFRKTESNETNCLNTNGRWQSDTQSCIYDSIPSEAISCSAQANGCRTYIGNQGNNVYIQSFDTFEDGAGSLDWYAGSEGTSTEGLSRVGESVTVGGHSLFVSQPVNTIHKFINIQKNSLYTLSFWAKTDNPAGEVITAKFSTSVPDQQDSTLEEFASLANNLRLTNEWRNYTLGPVFVSWDDVSNNSLIFDSLDSQVYLDNISLKVVKDNVYVVKNSWNTPDSCNRNIFGAPEQGAMLGCQAYQDLLGQTHNLKSFTNLCRSSVVGCQVLIDTQNSINPNQQLFNDDNMSALDDYIVPKDNLITLVVDDKYSCTKDNKGCQKLGQPTFQGTTTTYNDIYIKNDPDKYINVPNAIMCNEESLGCMELINDVGNAEYFKIDPSKLCQYTTSTLNSQGVEGWFKKGSSTLGCASLNFDTIQTCQANGGGWSQQYNQCVPILTEINDQDICNLKNGEWMSDTSKCLAYPFTIYKVDEANKYKGFVGQCDSKWNGCTEFIDINPNYVFNGSFESNDPTGLLSNWQTKAASSGSQKIETDNPKLGSKAIKLIKRTSQDCPSTYLYPNSSCLLDETIVPSYAISQSIARLEKGKTYKISFYYHVPDDAKGRGEECPLPEASFEFNSLDPTVPQGPRYIFAPETDWKKVEVLYTVPTDIGDDLQDFELVLFAPLNLNQSADIGNCPDSYIVYDQVEVKDNTEDSYYVIDQGANLDRSSCTNVDWNAGCVQFLNTDKDSAEILKVQADRNCEEWAVCTSYCSDPQYKTENDCLLANEDWRAGLCTETSLCSESSGGKCTKLSVTKDNVRYDLNNQPLVVKRISDYVNKEGYIYRFGAGQLNDLTEWRAGDFSGYTIPDRLPIESEIEENFSTYPLVNNLSTQEDNRFVEPVCKIFPAQDSPMPYDLIKQPGYKDLINLYSPSTQLNQLGNLCNYEEANALGTKVNFPLGSIPAVTEKICTSPSDVKGKICASDADCQNGPISGTSGAGTTGVCSPIENVKDFFGLEGMCLESDVLNPIYDGIYQNSYGSDYDYQPYACLTYFPFLIDLCPYYKEENNCNLNPTCAWQNNQCNQKTATAVTLNIIINAPTKNSNASITDTTISVSASSGINSSNISIDVGNTTVGTSSFLCTQTSAIQVDCSINIDSSGDLAIIATDNAGNTANKIESGYVINP